MDYNTTVSLEYENDDDYRVCVLNAYNIIVKENGMEEALMDLFSKQYKMFSTVRGSNVIVNMFNEIISSKKLPDYLVATNEYLFIYLHNYDYFTDMHKINCAYLKQENNLIELCNVLKNKILEQ